jgi:flavin reductase (DIM6/NTAB) family NADH-FMN oxidoreductase RutF
VSEPLDVDLFRAAVGRTAASVAIVAARTAEGFRALTVSSFTAASWDPPLVLVCVDRHFRGHDLLVAAEAFALSLLTDRQEFLAERFAGRAPGSTGRFEDVAHELAPSGSPVLRGALAWLDCRRVAVHPAGDHTVLLGEATAAAEGGGSPLLYFAGRYARLGK